VNPEKYPNAKQKSLPQISQKGKLQKYSNTRLRSHRRTNPKREPKKHPKKNRQKYHTGINP
jgi:hypothetical protein